MANFEEIMKLQLYHDAMIIATDMRFHPEVALPRFQLANFLREHYHQDRDEDATITEERSGVKSVRP